MKRIPITLVFYRSLGNGESKVFQVAHWGYEVCPGLAVAKVLAWDYRAEKFEPTTRRRWQITHVPSGSRLRGDFNSLRSAEVIAARLAPLTDWTVEAHVLASLPMQVEAGIREVLYGY